MKSSQVDDDSRSVASTDGEVSSDGEERQREEAAGRREDKHTRDRPEQTDRRPDERESDGRWLPYHNQLIYPMHVCITGGRIVHTRRAETLFEDGLVERGARTSIVERTEGSRPETQ